jgi:capsular polysaccharide biosynthesis protein
MDATDAQAASRQRVLGFADVVRIPLRRWRIVAAATAVITIVTLAYLLFIPATYRATNVVVLRPVVTDPFTFPSSGADRVINMTAENGIALGNEVIDATGQALGREPKDVRDALSVEVPTGGQVLRFTYAGHSEDEAVAGANAAAATYLRVRESIYGKQRDALLLSYDSTIRQVTDQRKAAQKGLPGSGEATSLPPRIQAMLDQVSALNDQIAQLANQRAKIASADLSPGSVAAAARAPVPSSHDRAPLFVAGALIGGLLVGMVLAHGREALDRRVRSLDQAADLVGVPTLGTVRAARRGNDAGVAADARYVSLAVLKWIDRHPDRPVVVLSGRDTENRSTVAGHLAAAIAETGQTVHLAAPEATREQLRGILQAAHLRTPPRQRAKAAQPLHDKGAASGVVRLPHAGVRLAATPVPGKPAPRDPDTTAVITVPDKSPEATVVMTAPDKVSEPRITPPVTAGHQSESESGAVLIGAGEVRVCAFGAEPEEGVVVIDAPPADLDPSGVRAAQDGVAVLVVARDRTRTAELARLVDRLRVAGAQTAGFVLTGGRGA